MKYPTINKTKLDYVNRKRFDYLKNDITFSITFDNKENKLGLTEKDISLLAWNLATKIISQPY